MCSSTIEHPNGPLEIMCDPLDSAALSMPVFRLTPSTDFLSNTEESQVDPDDPLAQLIKSADCIECEPRSLIVLALEHSYPRSALLAQNSGFRFVDLASTLELDFSGAIPVATGSPVDLEVREVYPTQAHSLARQIYGAFRINRLALDPLMDQQNVENRFFRWMTSVADERRAAVWIFFDPVLKRDVGAFRVSWQAPEELLWELTTVFDGMRGQGVGRRVWLAALAKSKDLGARKVRTRISLGNVRLHTLYSTVGFRYTTVEQIFHWHVSQPKNHGQV